jgi:hypothetical protein
MSGRIGCIFFAGFGKIYIFAAGFKEKQYRQINGREAGDDAPEQEGEKIKVIKDKLMFNC